MINLNQFYAYIYSSSSLNRIWIILFVIHINAKNDMEEYIFNPYIEQIIPRGAVNINGQ